MLRFTGFCFIAFSLITITACDASDGERRAEHQADQHDTHRHGTDAHTRDSPISGDLYPLQVDPLGASLVDVTKPTVRRHDGRVLHFASEANAKQFEADPAKFLKKVDQRIVQTQKPRYPLARCAVSGDKLGSMGDPIDYMHGNRLVRFCCKGCIKTFKKEPAKYLAKIDAAVIKAQKDDYPRQTCVVSDEKLGSMGDPIDYVIGTRLVRFCCKGCVKTFKKNPARYLAQLGGDEHTQHGHDHERTG